VATGFETIGIGVTTGVGTVAGEVGSDCPPPVLAGVNFTKGGSTYVVETESLNGKIDGGVPPGVG